MKKLLLLFSVIIMITGCYKDDINDLNSKYNELKKEQLRQAELLVSYQTLIQALENKLTVSDVVASQGSYKIIFSNGTSIVIKDGYTPIMTIGENGNWYVDGVDSGKKSTGIDGSAPKLEIINGYWYVDNVNTGVKAQGDNGKDGSDGSASPSIISVVDNGTSVVFYMSDGTTVKMVKAEFRGLYVLSEGSWGAGDGQLVYYDYNPTSDKYIRNDAKRFKNYGDTPNDLIVYGSKMYCAISGKGDASGAVVRVINTDTGVTIQDIEILDGANALVPRRFTSYKGKIYVSLYSGAVAQIDTTSFTTKVATLSGTFSEGLSAYNNSLYICNSGQGACNTVSVVTISTFKESEVITVPYNPINIISTDNGEFYLQTSSVYSGPSAGDPANLHILNAQSKSITKTFNVPVESIVAGKNYIYGSATDWSDYSGILKKISIADKTVSDFTTATNKLAFAYKLAVNPLTNEVYLTQMMGQDINRFKADGTHIETLKCGQQNGSAVVFINKIK